MANSRVFGIHNREAVNEFLHISNVTIVSMRKTSMPDMNVNRRRICFNNVYLYGIIDKAKLR
jgi:hypothetical protein